MLVERAFRINLPQYHCTVCKSATMTTLKLALFQGEAKLGDVSHNLTKITKQMEVAKESGAVLVIFPELFLTGYLLSSEEMKRLAEDKQGASFQQLSAAAKQLDIAVLYGYPEVDSSSGTPVYYNSAQLIDKDGSSLINYQKTHLWIDSDGYERVFTAGKELSNVVECCGMKIGVLICFDVDFPEAVRVLVLRGANVILVPTAVSNDFEYTKIGKMIIPARALENRVHVAYVNHCGGEFSGGSVCCNPRGDMLGMKETSEETMLIANIDLLDKASYDYISYRRPALYKDLVA